MSRTDKAIVEKVANIAYINNYEFLYSEVPDSRKALNSHIRKLPNKLNTKPYKGSAESWRI